MNLPKIRFNVMSLEANIETIKWAFFEDGDADVHYHTIQCFPDLASIDLNTPKKEIYRIIERVVTRDYIKNKERIISETERYNNLWAEYNDKYFEMLSKFLGVTFPQEIKEIDAFVGLLPVFPRNLDSFSFSISADVDEWILIETAAHETLHFLWFEKWKSMYPETPRQNFDPPYIEWKYSEMVTDPILNNKPFNELFDFTEKGYDSFYELYDDGELVMDKLRSIYSTNDSIEHKIEKGFAYITNYLNKTNEKSYK